MLDRHQYKIRGVFIVVLFALFIWLFFGLIATELFRLQSNMHFRYSLRTELNYYVTTELKYDQYVDEYIQDNYNVVDRGLTSILNISKVKLDSIPSVAGQKEIDLQQQIAFKDSPNSLEIFTIKKDDLFRSIKYRYLLDEFIEDQEIHRLNLNAFHDEDRFTVKRCAYYYYPRLDVIVVVEKTMDPEWVDKESVKENLYNYSIIGNSKTVGDIFVVDKSGRILYDNHNVIKNKFLEGKDLTSQKSLMTVITDKAGGFVEFTFPSDGKRKLAYVIYSKANDSYYIDMIDKSKYHSNGSAGRLQMLMVAAISMSAVALLFVFVVIRRTARLLGEL